MAQCDACRKQTSGKIIRTVTGRRICSACNQNLLGATAGILAAPDASTSAKTASAVATSGFFSRLRRRGASGS